MTTPTGPVLFNTSGSSDSQASGTGPATAVFGTGASSTASSAVVDLTADTPDLSGIVAGDMFWIDSTSGRQFSSIVSVDDGADTVTCDNTFTNTESTRNWGIGGKRATLAGSSTLYASGGDWQSDWSIFLESGYTETFSATTNFYTAGSVTTGDVALIEGDSSGTRPIITFTNNGTGWLLRSNHTTVKGIDFRNTHVTKSASYALHFDAAFACAEDVLINNATNNFWRGINHSSGGTSGPLLAKKCSIENCASHAIRIANQTSSVIDECTLMDNGGDGVLIDDHRYPHVITDCIISTNGGHGIEVDPGTNTQSSLTIAGNVIHKSTSSGIHMSKLASQAVSLIKDNIIFDNGAYGIEAAANGETFGQEGIDRNAFYSNTSGNYLNITAGANDIILTADPFVDAANDDFNLNTTSGGGQDLRDETVTMP